MPATDIASAAAGSTPWGAVAQGVLGIGQSIIGGINAKKAQRKYENMIDSYQPNQSIMDYYSKALQRYNQNPYDSTIYRMQQQNAGRGLATGLSALNNRKSAIAGAANLVRGYNDSLLKAAATAEGQQGQALSQLGQATQMKAGEDKYKFEAKANIYAAKAAGNNQVMNAGLQNIGNGLSNISDYYMAKKTYGQ